jgi:adenine deaminase
MSFEHIETAEGQLVDLPGRTIRPVRIRVREGRIASIEPVRSAPAHFILPGFVDAHVHVESSMLTPPQFARLAVVHGTIATVSDPHEIANVLGRKGVEFMIEDGERTPFRFYFGAPSCVPATPFETAGATVDVADVEALLDRPDVVYLAEMMNWPGVLNGDPVVFEKLGAAKRRGKPIDGHAPGLRGEDASRYAAAGISTDHESFGLLEARDKIAAGMKILIREGSAARNFDELHPLISEHPDRVMFCSDDKHPDELVEGHIDGMVRRALAAGHDLFDVLGAACRNPVIHYDLDLGLLREGDRADFIIVDSVQRVQVNKTVIGGLVVAEGGRSRIADMSSEHPNSFFDRRLRAADFRLEVVSENMRVIEALDGQLITKSLTVPVSQADGLAVSDPSRDVLKMAVVNRYEPAPPSMAFIRNLGLKEGAIASSVAHDSHNIVVVGADDTSMEVAANLILDHRGGIAAVCSSEKRVLPLPVGGLMSDLDGYRVASEYAAIDALARSMGSRLRSPFMTLSFMALLVIPELKLSDRGLFDGRRFEFVDLFV